MTGRSTGNPIVIIGGGMAGGNAAATLREEGFPGPVVLISREPGIPFGRPPLSKTYLRSEEDLDGWYVRPAGWYADHDVELRRGAAVVAVDPSAHVVTLDSGEEIGYQKVLIATGGRNRRLGIPGAGLPGIHYLRTVAECDAIKQEARPGRRAVVVGMGFIGCEVAASLTQLGVRVTAVFPGQDPAGEGPGRPGRRADRRHSPRERRRAAARRAGCRLRGHRPPGGGRDRHRSPYRVRFRRGGHRDRTRHPARRRVAQENGILVDELCRASAPDVYAAGDVANHLHPLFGRVRVEHLQQRREARRRRGAGPCSARRPPTTTSTASGPTSTSTSSSTSATPPSGTSSRSAAAWRRPSWSASTWWAG